MATILLVWTVPFKFDRSIDIFSQFYTLYMWAYEVIFDARVV